MHAHSPNTDALLTLLHQNFQVYSFIYFQLFHFVSFAAKWNSLSVECFPVHNMLNCLNSKVNRHFMLLCTFHVFFLVTSFDFFVLQWLNSLAGNEAHYTVIIIIIIKILVLKFKKKKKLLSTALKKLNISC